MASTPERAACSALAAWLTSSLPDVEVRDAWPDDDATLPARGLTLLLTGKATDEWTTPRADGHRKIHDALPADLGIDTVGIVDTASAVAALNPLRAAYVAHLADTAAHATADATNGPTEPDATDLPTGIALANNLRAKFIAHFAFAGTATPHPVADGLNAPRAPIATNEASLVALTKSLVDSLSAHFAARMYLWMLGARVQPVQIDIWTTHEAAREEMIGRVEQLVRQGAIQPEGPDVFEDYAPVGLGIAVDLGDDWPNASAAFDFEAPSRMDGGAQSQEWRATYEGTVDVPLLAWGQTARLARARFTMTVDNADRTVDVDWADNADGSTTTFAG